MPVHESFILKAFSLGFVNFDFVQPYYFFLLPQHVKKRREAVYQLLHSVQMEAMRLKSARNENATSKLVAVLLSIKSALAQMDSMFADFDLN